MKQRAYAAAGPSAGAITPEVSSITREFSLITREFSSITRELWASVVSRRLRSCLCIIAPIFARRACREGDLRNKGATRE